MNRYFEAHCKKLNQKWKPSVRTALALFQKPEYFDGYMYYGHGQVLVRERATHENTIEELPHNAGEVFDRQSQDIDDWFAIDDIKGFYNMLHPFYAARNKIEHLKIIVGPESFKFETRPIVPEDNPIPSAAWHVEGSYKPIKFAVDPKFLYDALNVYKQMKFEHVNIGVRGNQVILLSAGELEMLIAQIRTEW